MKRLALGLVILGVVALMIGVSVRAPGQAMNLDPMLINGVDTVGANITDGVPAPPPNGVNIRWQYQPGFPYSISAYLPMFNNYNTSDQTINASTTAMLNGGLISVPTTKLRIGTSFKWRLALSKTNAGTAPNTFAVQVGTNGTTADADVVSFSLENGTAAIDQAIIDIVVIIRGPLDANCIASGSFHLAHDKLNTGFSNSPNVVLFVDSAGFDATVADLKVSLAVTTAASTVFTFKQVLVEALNL